MYNKRGKAICRSAAGRACKFKLTWNYEDVSILLPVIGPVSTSAVADRKPRCLFADLLVLPLVLVYLGQRVLHALLLQSLRQFCHRKPGCTAHDELLQRVVYEFVLFLRANQKDTNLRNALQSKTEKAIKLKNFSLTRGFRWRFIETKPSRTKLSMSPRLLCRSLFR